MADLPATTDQNSNHLTDSFRISFADALVRGETPAEIAKKLYPSDTAARKRLRHRLWAIAGRDVRVHELVSLRARAIMIAGLGPATRALNRRSDKGNVQAIKLLFEASGLHNPRVQHEHSGEITVKLDMPRPNFVEAEATVADAEVVADPAQTRPQG